MTRRTSASVAIRSAKAASAIAALRWPLRRVHVTSFARDAKLASKRRKCSSPRCWASPRRSRRAAPLRAWPPTQCARRPTASSTPPTTARPKRSRNGSSTSAAIPSLSAWPSSAAGCRGSRAPSTSPTRATCRSCSRRGRCSAARCRRGRTPTATGSRRGCTSSSARTRT